MKGAGLDVISAEYLLGGDETIPADIYDKQGTAI